MCVDIERGDLPVIIDGIWMIVGSEVIGGHEHGGIYSVFIVKDLGVPWCISSE